MTISKWVVLKITVGFDLTFRSVCSDRLLERIETNGSFQFFRRRSESEHTDRNVELKPSVLFRTTPTHLEIVITWCYRKPFHVVFPPRKVSNPTCIILKLSLKYFSLDKTTSAAQRPVLFDDQLELAEDAVRGKNTVLVAPTGSGKTHVAAYIIHDHFISQRPKPIRDRCALFLVTTVRKAWLTLAERPCIYH